MLSVTFPEIVRALEELSCSLAPSEGHGYLCGVLCTRAHYPLECWLEEMIPEHEERVQADRQALDLLFTDTRQTLHSGSMSFDLLLPDDDAPLHTRVAALSQWCQGFLYGFGTGQPVGLEAVSADVSELLRDLTQIGRAILELEEGNEEEESAYAEIVEYVRVGVQLIYDEIDVVRETPAMARNEARNDDDIREHGERDAGLDPSQIH
ncbi:hypothetical protein ACG33_06110 [Steroidobacter denitrificans]|uniref:YecA family protein n=1 Tax=Steroidobacter denitrificans TaxID=465721 RepID=A0A127FAM9_STEDE|nr:UPF0149 family protein [Steroidobacter denitrificans]AMN46658.1 hypothetical protein ACG33_06110 [Steroidobacter denitrificans]